MSGEARRIPYEELANNLAGVFERIARDRESVLVERDGQAIAVVRPVAPVRPRRQRPSSSVLARVDASFQVVPALDPPRTLEEMTEIAAEEHAQHAAREGLA